MEDLHIKFVAPIVKLYIRREKIKDKSFSHILLDAKALNGRQILEYINGQGKLGKFKNHWLLWLSKWFKRLLKKEIGMDFCYQGFIQSRPPCIGLFPNMKWSNINSMNSWVWYFDETSTRVKIRRINWE